MYLAVIILPLLGSIVSGFFGRKVGVTGAQVVTCISVIATTIFAVLTFFEVGFNNISVNVCLCRWLDLASVNVLWSFHFDFLTVSMLIPVLVISSLVHVYSVGYMSSDPHNQRFFSYLSLFTFMMVVLVTSNNFLLMFVGWEGVGICSYLLVNFWFTRIAANQSSVSALLTNRVGDCFLTIGMFIMLLSFGNIDYTTVFSVAPFISENNITIIGACLLIGAMAKSSQIGLHVWLPLAMEGPTPVSALIHAATMVTAGVYLLMRASPLLEYTSTVLLACLWIGSITTVFSSVVGLFQQDIKKVIAYSTMSQLGMMVIAIGLSCYNLALFHLVNHAFYKGLLFLGAGSVIHAVADNQDFRKYGALILFLPLTYTAMLIGSLSLVAIPYMTGFYSKDFILESCFSLFNYSGIVVYFTAVIGAMFTTLYSAKILYLTFIASPNASIATYNKAHENDIFMSIPLVVLVYFSIYFGYITKDLFIGLGSQAYIDNSIFIHPMHEVYLTSEFGLSYFYKLLPFFLTIGLFITFVIVLEFMPKLVVTIKYTRFIYNTFSFLNLKFLFESIYNRFITTFLLNVGGDTTKVIDKGIIEKIGPNGLEKFLLFLSRSLNKLNTGVVTTYALYILVGFISYVSLPHILGNSLTLIVILFYFACIALSISYFDINKDKYVKQNFIVKADLDTVQALHLVLTGLWWATAAVLTISVVRRVGREVKGVNGDSEHSSNTKQAESSTSLNDSCSPEYSSSDIPLTLQQDVITSFFRKTYLEHIEPYDNWNTIINPSSKLWHAAGDLGSFAWSHPYITLPFFASLSLTVVSLSFYIKLYKRTYNTLPTEEHINIPFDRINRTAVWDVREPDIINTNIDRLIADPEPVFIRGRILEFADTFICNNELFRNGSSWLDYQRIIDRTNSSDHSNRIDFVNEQVNERLIAPITNWVVANFHTWSTIVPIPDNNENLATMFRGVQCYIKNPFPRWLPDYSNAGMGHSNRGGFFQFVLTETRGEIVQVEDLAGHISLCVDIVERLLWYNETVNGVFAGLGFY